MSLPEKFAKLVGNWDGSKRLILSPEDPIRDCDATACVGLEANGKFLKINYEWSFEGERQEGLIIFRVDKEAKAKSVWFDSWHQGDDFMNATGTLTDGQISVKAHQTQPEYSDWAWRTTLESIDDNSFAFNMFNVFPDGKESAAVEMKFKRRD